MIERARPTDGELLAAVDLGSNSFHLLLVRRFGDCVETVHHRRDSVRLAAGVDANGVIDPARLAAALAVLREYGGEIARAGCTRVAAAATEAVRRLSDIAAFLDAASAALGQPVEVVSGDDEARLIWRGAVHALPPSPRRRLVIDIGGGSTEFILGADTVPCLLESVPVGCVVSALAMFPDGRLDAGAWQRGLRSLRAVLQPVAARFAAAGHDEAWACAGTAVTLARMQAATGGRPDAIVAAELAPLVERTLACGHVDRLHAPGLDAEHAPIAAGGLLVMQAVMQAFDLPCVAVRDFAMRHGLIQSLLVVPNPA